MIKDVSQDVAELLKTYMAPTVASIARRIESDLLGLYEGFSAAEPSPAQPPDGGCATKEEKNS